MEACRAITRELRDCAQPLSAEYLTSAEAEAAGEDTDSCSSQYPSLGGRSHADSVYEMGQVDIISNCMAWIVNMFGKYLVSGPGESDQESGAPGLRRDEAGAGAGEP